MTDSSPPAASVTLLPPSSTSSFTNKLLPHSPPASSVSNLQPLSATCRFCLHLQILTGHCNRHLQPPEDDHSP
ncbi:hypothetical protein NQZ68_035520 [Dissostichus eleginoides]|nr:hypothetical protein NQZ68_035520 [Dissostichus eleginoides]